MKIKYWGHSCFFLASEGGTTLVTDPFGDIGLALPHLKADGVTLSHSHYDHANLSAVTAKKVFDRAGEYRLGDFRLTAKESFHDDAHGAKRGKNLIFRFEADGISVCHLGDLGEPCTEETVKLIGPCDVLLIPVGGNYTIGAAEAEKYVRALAPSAVIPMHYYVEGLKIDIAPCDGFLSRFGKTERVAGSYTPVPSGETKIIYMERAN